MSKNSKIFLRIVTAKIIAIVALFAAQNPMFTLTPPSA